MLTHEEIESLPRDPEAAFVKLVDLVEIKYKEWGDDRSWYAQEDYAQAILAFLDLNPLISNDFEKYVSISISEVNRWWDEFHADVKRCRNRILFRHRSSGISYAPGYIELGTERKAEIHDLLVKIRKCINALDIHENMRERLFSCLNNLAREVDRFRTNVESYGEMMVEVASYTGEVAEKLGPVATLMKAFGFSLAAQREENKTKALPKPKKVPQLAPPKTQDLDDEIPF